MASTPLCRAFAAETLEGAPDAPLVLTCEHASARVPRPWRAGPGDAERLASHWGLDIGARAFTLALARRTASPAVLARFTRLLCDPNRDPSDPTCFLEEIEGRPLGLGQGLGRDARALRIERLHRPYHAAIDALLARRTTAGPPPLLLSVHSFTPVWGGAPRPMDVGLLFFEPERPLALALAQDLGALGLRVALEAPYSAQAGLAWSVEVHARRFGLRPLELELNQAILPSPAAARALAHRLAPLMVRASARAARR